jgi:indolepyruvate ferredoxin oxidoreductase
MARLSPANLQVAVALASLPEQIRGFGHVKEAAIARVASQRAALLAKFEQAETAGAPAHSHAAE